MASVSENAHLDRLLIGFDVGLTGSNGGDKLRAARLRRGNLRGGGGGLMLQLR